MEKDKNNRGRSLIKTVKIIIIRECDSVSGRNRKERKKEKETERDKEKCDRRKTKWRKGESLTWNRREWYKRKREKNIYVLGEESGKEMAKKENE